MNSEDIFRAGRALPEKLVAQALARGDTAAVVTATESISFGELAGHSADLARHLRDLGVGPDDTVGVFAEPSVDSMTGVWGILFAGAAYLPLSPEYPQARLRYMIEDAGVRVIVTQKRLQDRLAELAPADTVVVTREDVPGATDNAPPLPAPRPTDLAYVIYTSGSTGKPKGVLIEHRAITARMHWLHTAHGLDESRTVLQKTPLSFDAAQWEVLAPAYGATVVVADPGAYRDAERLVELMAEHGVTTLQGVPTLLQALVDTEDLGRCTALTQVFSGGESLSRQLAVDITTALPRATLVNLYGPTETTINSSSHTVDRDTVAQGPNTISIGTPADGTTYHILCPDGSRTVPGEVGELHIGGIQLARGYLNRPDVTGERFVTVAGTRLYRTGDLAFWDTDGTVRFVGRTDNQVKLRGFRVELDEITSAIETHTWVKNAAVPVHDNPRTGFQNLVAFIALNPKEAALMDQGNHDAHHQSKQSRLQVRAQLAGVGVRDAAELDGKPVVDLPGTDEQRRLAFLRKTYRFYEGGPADKAGILALLDRREPAAHSRVPHTIELADLGGILRHLGPFHSAERLLPKYAYASPGSLYGTGPEPTKRATTTRRS